MDVTYPEPTKPLGPETTDMAVLNGQDEEVPLLYETEEARIILQVVQEHDRREEFVRMSEVRKWRKHLHYWNSLQYLAYDFSAHDWITPQQLMEQDPQADIDPAVYAKVVNVYKAHGEILIGALTSNTPTVRFFPKDADDAEDVTSAKAHSKIADLIQRHNKARLLLMKSLFIMYNQGLVACYNENKADYRFGSISVQDTEDVQVTNRNFYCPSCGLEFGSQQFQPDDLPPGQDQSGGTPGISSSQAPPSPQMQPQPQTPPMPGAEGPMLSQQTCPQCQQTVMPDHDDTQEMITQSAGSHKEPKNRECLEVFGPLNVKIPVWCRDQISTPYLILETEEPANLMKEIYPEVADKITPSAYPDLYEREARIPSQYRGTFGDFPRGLVTVQRVWLRPWAFNEFEAKEDEIKLLKQKYKNGCYVVIINRDLIVEVLPDNLDDHWTISENPLSEILHAEPIGTPMVPLQDITNELANLTLETIEFGIPEIFADSRVLDFDAYPRQEARPGQISPATAPGGRSLGEGFYEIKASSLSREVELFADRIFTVSQFVMGSYPSIYGGAQESGSGTAKEYELSKASALQRLSTTWTILQEWWCKVTQKAVKSYVKNLREDEKFVRSKGSNFENVWIRRSELTGEVGEVEPEISETFPVSWTQKRDVILNLIQMKDPDIATVIRHPENAGLIASIIGVPELYIPGDDDRNKQLYEISILIRQEPVEMGMPPMAPGQMSTQGPPQGPADIPTGPSGEPPPQGPSPQPQSQGSMSGGGAGQMPPSGMGAIPPTPNEAPPQDGLLSSIKVDPLIDNHDVEAEICRAWLKSEVGIDAKTNNPGGYLNVKTHLGEHQFFIDQKSMMMPPPGGPQPGPQQPQPGA